MKEQTVCAWCKHPIGAIRVTLSTEKGREEVCATCGRAEVERRQKETLTAAIAEHVMYPNEEKGA